MAIQPNCQDVELKDQGKVGFDIEPNKVLAWLVAGEVVLIDVRETAEYQEGYISGALLCPLSTFQPKLFPCFPGKRVVFHCAAGQRSAAVCRKLKQIGYQGDFFNMSGGMREWKALGLELGDVFTNAA
tara:strand:+ start:2140 stop:2523 length:384 start_codon:yes stop_codon:yes gene_type:complete